VAEINNLILEFPYTKTVLLISENKMMLEKSNKMIRLTENVRSVMAHYLKREQVKKPKNT
jgi:hypothetical protein